jgi:hypothetical protein
MRDTTAVLINTRGRPEKLTAAIMTLAGLAAQPEKITFGVRYDADDPDTEKALVRLGAHVRLKTFSGTRPRSMGGEINRMAAGIDAAFYHVLTDYIVPVTVYWDLSQFEQREREHAFVSCWSLAPGPTSPDYPVISRAWLDAAGGRIFTNNFPFWFDDMDLTHRYILAKGQLIHPITSMGNAIGLHARKDKTQRMRDLEFWFAYYRHLEPGRVEWAKSTRKNLGLKPMRRGEFNEWLSKTREFDAIWIKKHLTAKTTERLGDMRPPTAAYKARKKEAQEEMEKEMQP